MFYRHPCRGTRYGSLISVAESTAAHKLACSLAVERIKVSATKIVGTRCQLADIEVNTDLAVRSILSDVLGLSPEKVAGFNDTTPLFGALPELDSMAVASLLTEIEDRLAIVIDDDEVDGDMLGSFGALTSFVRGKLTK